MSVCSHLSVGKFYKSISPRQTHSVAFCVPTDVTYSSAEKTLAFVVSWFGCTWKTIKYVFCTCISKMLQLPGNQPKNYPRKPNTWVQYCTYLHLCAYICLQRYMWSYFNIKETGLGEFLKITGIVYCHFCQCELSGKAGENKALYEMGRDFGKPRGVHSSCSGVLRSEGFTGHVEVTGKVYKHCAGDNCTQLVL